VDVVGNADSLWKLLGWLRYGVELYAPNGEPRWWGHIEEMELVSGAITIGVSLESMSNSIAVAYVSGVTRNTSAYLDDDDSVDTYGRKELILLQDNLTEAGAEELQTTVLNARRYPISSLVIGDVRETRATLYCRGWWQTLAWENYARDEGLVENVAGSQPQKFGYGFTSAKVGFEKEQRFISNIDGYFLGLTKGDKLRISGAAGNGPATYTVESGTNREPHSFGPSTTIAFFRETVEVSSETLRATLDKPRKMGHHNINSGVLVVRRKSDEQLWAETTDYTVDLLNGTLTALSTGGIANNEELQLEYDYLEYRIEDTDLEMDNFIAHDFIQVSGSGSNNTYFRILSTTEGGAILYVREPVQNEGPGASVTIIRGNYVQVEEELADETPGATVTVQGFGEGIAQSFQIGSDAPWTIDGIEVKIRKVGTPSDNVRIALRADSSGDPSTVLEYSSEISADNLSTDFAWTKFSFANTYELQLSTTYWLLVARLGSQDPDDYYEVTVDEDLGYSSGVLKGYNGTAWETRDTDADMAFRVLGAEETTVQIEQLVSQDAQFLTGVDVVDDSGIETHQYRFGEYTAQTELLDLLNIGTTGKRRLLARVNRDRELKVWAEPAEPTQPDYYLRSDGRIVTKLNQPLDAGDLSFVGSWLGFLDVLPGTAALSYIVKPAPFLVEWAEYDIESGRTRLQPKEAASPFDIGVGQ
jgi:hypothetical protein